MATEHCGKGYCGSISCGCACPLCVTFFDEDDLPVAVPEQRQGLPKFVQPSRWTCLPTAFAMVLHPRLGREVLEELLAYVSRDDDRGIHVQEILSWCIQHDIFFSPFESDPDMERPKCKAGCRNGFVERISDFHGEPVDDPCRACNGSGDEPLPPLKVTPISELLKRHDGVLLGHKKGTDRYHAVAWCRESQRCIDPDGGIYGVDEFSVDTFWAVL